MITQCIGKRQALKVIAAEDDALEESKEGESEK